MVVHSWHCVEKSLTHKYMISSNSFQHDSVQKKNRHLCNKKYIHSHNLIWKNTKKLGGGNGYAISGSWCLPWLVAEVKASWETLWPAQNNRRQDNDERTNTDWGDATRRYLTDLINNLFPFDPVIFEVIIDVQHKNRKFIQIVKVQPEHTHRHTVRFL